MPPVGRFRNLSLSFHKLNPFLAVVVEPVGMWATRFLALSTYPQAGSPQKFVWACDTPEPDVYARRCKN